MKNMLFALVCLGLMIFTSCDSPVGPTRSTVEFMYERVEEDGSGLDAVAMFVIQGSTGGVERVYRWEKISYNTWTGELYLDYSKGAGYYAFVQDRGARFAYDMGRRIFARDRDKNQDWVELKHVIPNPYGTGEAARFELGPRGVYF